MTIGTDGEIGTVFTTWGKKSPEQQQQWFDYMRSEWVPLMNGYATLIHHKDNPYYQGTRDERS